MDIQDKIYIFVVTFLIIWLIQRVLFKWKLYYFSWQIPGPVAFPFVGNLLTMMNKVEFDITQLAILFEEYMKTYGGKEKMFRIWTPDIHLVTADANLVQQICAKTLAKADVYQGLGGPEFKKSVVVTQNVHEWKIVRKLISPSFNTTKIKNSYMTNFYEETMKILPTFDQLSEGVQPIFPPRIIEKFALDSVMRSFVGLDPQDPSYQKYSPPELYHTMFKIFQEKVLNPLLLNPVVAYCTGHKQIQEECFNSGYKFCKEFIVDKQGSTNVPDIEKNLSQKLLENKNLSQDEVFAHILTIIGAGYDTTTTTNSVALIMMALHPSLQIKVYEEVIQVLGEDITVRPSYDDLLKLEYVERFLKECLRIVPPAPVIARKTDKEESYQLDHNKTLTVPKGVTLSLMIGQILKSPDYYTKPDVFDPDRWLPNEVEKRHPHCYIPFSSGIRNCPGIKYAMAQVTLFISIMVRKYEILPSEECKTLKDVKLFMNYTTELQENCKIRLRRRNNK